jgi:hypothetical protein
MTHAGLPEEPQALFDHGTRPDHDLSRYVVQCAWAAALANGEVEPDPVLDAVLEDGPGGCGDLSRNDLAFTGTYLPLPSSDGAQAQRYAEALLIERAMYEYLAPEIAEAIAARG